MAICDDHPGLRAEIIVDGQPLQEYEDEEGAPGTITKYIEASTDKEFAMKTTFSPPFPTEYGVEVEIIVDAALPRALAYAPEDLHASGGHFKFGVNFRENGKWYHKKYRFTALNIGNFTFDNKYTLAYISLVEEAESMPSVANLKKDLQSKGSIKLNCRFITNFRPSDSPYTGAPVKDLNAVGVIPEKVLKGDARSHQATFSKPRPKATPKRAPPMYDHVNGAPFAKFHFKYRSLASLKALQLIVNDDADENPASVDGLKEDDMTPEQLREALRRSRKREEDSRRIKQEANAARNVKRELREDVDLEDDGEVTILEIRDRKRPRGEQDVIVLE
ncbi:hypothetical protein BKA63DRAFT_574293 [Paraphoma chrysanthemicola]|nr:hypothetical protein BKA63DRAFT_574293 [Paraphoma chrysanthemicola]